MLKRILLIIFVFYILILVQTSFLIPFNVSGIIFSLVLLAVVFINIFNFPSFSEGGRRNFSFFAFLSEAREKKKRSFFAFSPQEKISSAIIGGFCLDVFSLNNAGGFFGFYTLVLVGFSLLLKIILERYVRIPIIRKI